MENRLKSKILIFGKSIIKDKSLSRSLKEIGQVKVWDYYKQPDNNFQNVLVDLVVFEFSNQWEEELQLLKYLQSVKPDIPIIVISQADSMETTIKSLKCGVDDVFKSPYRIDLLQDRIKAILARKIPPMSMSERK